MNKKYTKGLILLGVTLSIGLSSCQFVKKYKTPEIDTADLYRDMTSADTTTIANIPWSEYFTDPYLQAIIDEGINNNHDLQIALARIKQAEATSGMAKGAYFANVALAGQVQHARHSYDEDRGKDVLGYNSTSYTLGIAATWVG